MANQFFEKKHFIGLDQARKMTKKFREDKDKIVKDEYKGKHLIPDSETFDRAAFDTVLQTEGCRGIRIYYGMKQDDQRVHAIIVGVDEEGNDLLPIEGVAMDGVNRYIIEDGNACPPNCPPSSGL